MKINHLSFAVLTVIGLMACGGNQATDDPTIDKNPAVSDANPNVSTGSHHGNFSPVETEKEKETEKTEESNSVSSAHSEPSIPISSGKAPSSHKPIIITSNQKNEPPKEKPAEKPTEKENKAPTTTSNTSSLTDIERQNKKQKTKNKEDKLKETQETVEQEFKKDNLFAENQDKNVTTTTISKLELKNEEQIPITKTDLGNGKSELFVPEGKENDIEIFDDKNNEGKKPNQIKREFSSAINNGKPVTLKSKNTDLYGTQYYVQKTKEIDFNGKKQYVADEVINAIDSNVSNMINIEDYVKEKYKGGQKPYSHFGIKQLVKYNYDQDNNSTATIKDLSAFVDGEKTEKIPEGLAHYVGSAYLALGLPENNNFEKSPMIRLANFSANADFGQNKFIDIEIYTDVGDKPEDSNRFTTPFNIPAPKKGSTNIYRNPNDIKFVSLAERNNKINAPIFAEDIHAEGKITGNSFTAYGIGKDQEETMSKIIGSFYGDKAQEIGGTISGKDEKAGTYIGAFGGLQLSIEKPKEE